MCDFPASQIIKVHQKFVVKYIHGAWMHPDRCGWYLDGYKFITLFKVSSTGIHNNVMSKDFTIVLINCN